jgi:DoxX
VFVYLAGVIETGGGLLLIMGLLARLAALALAADMPGAIVVGLIRLGAGAWSPGCRITRLTRSAELPRRKTSPARTQTVATASTPRSPMNGESNGTGIDPRAASRRARP